MCDFDVIEGKIRLNVVKTRSLVKYHKTAAISRPFLTFLKKVNGVYALQILLKILFGTIFLEKKIFIHVNLKNYSQRAVLASCCAR